ncbi:hypothetical protein [Dethiothermospora halolimnae]|uniref:hypothetical protein n=1 Tax=Dethiothermospora halolimnae TaxID=3114390 RepID=UPI003CCBB901
MNGKYFKILLIVLLLIILTQRVIIHMTFKNTKNIIQVINNDEISKENIDITEKDESIRARFSGKSIYSITPDDKNWNKLTTKEEKVKACRIPSDTLKEMNTNELIKAVIEFPLIVNLHLHNTPEEGLKALQKESDAFKELLKRTDAGEKLSNILNNKTNIKYFQEIDTFDIETLKILQTRFN